MDRRQFIAALSLLAANLARAQGDKPANRNIKWALSEALWGYYPPAPFIDMLAVMQETGFIGVRLAGFPHILSDYQMTATQMLREVSKRNLHVVTISWNGALHDPSQRLVVLESARNAMKFLADSQPAGDAIACCISRVVRTLQSDRGVGRRDGLYGGPAQSYGPDGSESG